MLDCEEKYDKNISTLQEEIYGIVSILKIIEDEEFDIDELLELIDEITEHNELSNYSLSESFFEEKSTMKSTNITMKSFMEERRNRLKSILRNKSKLSRYNENIRLTMNQIKSICISLKPICNSEDTKNINKSELLLEDKSHKENSIRNETKSCNFQEIKKSRLKSPEYKSISNVDMNDIKLVSTPRSNKLVKYDKTLLKNIKSSINIKTGNNIKSPSFSHLSYENIDTTKSKSIRNKSSIPESSIKFNDESRDYDEYLTDVDSEMSIKTSSLPKPILSEINTNNGEKMKRHKSRIIANPLENTKKSHPDTKFINISKRSLRSQSRINPSCVSYFIDQDGSIAHENTAVTHISYSPIDYSKMYINKTPKSMIQPSQSQSSSPHQSSSPLQSQHKSLSQPKSLSQRKSLSQSKSLSQPKSQSKSLSQPKSQSKSLSQPKSQSKSLSQPKSQSLSKPQHKISQNSQKPEIKDISLSRKNIYTFPQNTDVINTVDHSISETNANNSENSYSSHKAINENYIVDESLISKRNTTQKRKKNMRKSRTQCRASTKERNTILKDYKKPKYFSRKKLTSKIGKDKKSIDLYDKIKEFKLISTKKPNITPDSESLSPKGYTNSRRLLSIKDMKHSFLANL